MASKLLMMEQKLRHTENILVSNRTFEVYKTKIKVLKSTLTEIII